MHSDEFQSFLKANLPAMGYRWERFDRRNIRRRVHSRMESLRIYELEKYARLIHQDEEERSRLDSLLRLTITRFFRNSWLWSDLESLLPEVDGRLSGKEALRVWSAGCAGGEEPFSMGMLLDHLARSGHLKHPWTVLGTDTDAPSLQRSREAKYKWGSLREVPGHLLDHWFTEEDGLWILNEKVRYFVEIQQHNLITMDPPGQFHVVLLRNSVLTYNTDEIQLKILGRIHDCLLSPGYLVTGRTEKMPEGVGFDQVSRCIYRMT